MSRIERRAKEAKASGSIVQVADVFTEYLRQGQSSARLRRIFEKAGVPVSGNVSGVQPIGDNPHLYK